MAVPNIFAGTPGGTTAQLDANWAYFADSIVVYDAWVRVASPALGLEVYGAASSTSTLRLGQPGTVNWNIQNKAITGHLSLNNGGVDLLLLTSGGEMLLGKTSAFGQTFRFVAEASSTMAIPACFSDSRVDAVSSTCVSIYRTGVQVGSISTTNTATAYNTSSDYRLKNNPQPLTGSGAFIDSLQPKTWRWAADGTPGVGFIAHEVAAVSPASVVGAKDAVDDDGQPVHQTMEYGSAEFVANIVAELQSLRARVAALET